MQAVLSPAKMTLATILCAVAPAQSPAQSAQTVTRPAAPVDAIQGLVTAFKHYPVVVIGESHWLRQAGDFYMRLVRDPSVQENIQDIVIEFASRQNQPLLDRYVGGEDVPIEEVKHIWRDTTKVGSWESPIYAEWLASIQDVNKTLPRTQRIRVLAGDTAVDWTRMHTHEDWVALGDNNLSFVDVVIHQVLEKNHHALVVLGGNHVTKSGDRNAGQNFTTHIESLYPGSIYVALEYGVATGWQDSATEALLHAPQQSAPTLYALAGSPLATTWMGKNADALLYLGPHDAIGVAHPLPGTVEPEYLKEVDRRSLIEWGELRVHSDLAPYTSNVGKVP